MTVQVKTVDLNSLLIKNPVVSYFVRVSGDSMIDAGIFDNDILLVDRSLEVISGDIVVAALNGCFTVKEFRSEPLALIPHNEAMSPILISPNDEFELFGVVAGLVRTL